MFFVHLSDTWWDGTDEKTLHASASIDAIRLQIHEQENEMTTCLVWTTSGISIPYHLVWGYVFRVTDDEKKVCIFKGQLSRPFAHTQDHFTVLRFQADTPLITEQQKKIRTQHADMPIFDPLVHQTVFQTNQKEWVEPTAWVWAYDPCGHTVALVDPWWGRTTHAVGAQDVIDPPVVAVQHHAPTRARVQVSADWDQEGEGVISLESVLRSACTDGLITTLTGPDLKKRFWQTGSRLKNQGLDVIFSELTRTDPPRQMLGAPMRSEWDIALTDEKTVTLKQEWFSCRLWMAWAYRAHRRETVCFQMHTARSQPSVHTTEGIEYVLQVHPCVRMHPEKWQPHIFYRCGDRIQHQDRLYRCVAHHRSTEPFQPSMWQDIPPFQRDLAPSAASFFHTDRGHAVLECIMQRIANALKKNARQTRVRLRGFSELFWHIHTSDSVHYTDPQACSYIGKVVDVTHTLEADTEHYWTDITLACCGDGDRSVFKSKQTPFSEEFAPPMYGSFQDQQPMMPLDLEDVRPEHVVRQIDVLYDATQQKEKVMAHQPRTTDALEDILRHHPTRLKLHVTPMRPKEIVSHTISIPWVEAISIPQQVEV